MVNNIWFVYAYFFCIYMLCYYVLCAILFYVKNFMVLVWINLLYMTSEFRLSVLCFPSQCLVTEMKDSIKHQVSAVDNGVSLQPSYRVQTQRSHKPNLDSSHFTSKITAQPNYNQSNTVRPNSKMRDAVSSANFSFEINTVVRKDPFYFISNIYTAPWHHWNTFWNV